MKAKPALLAPCTIDWHRELTNLIALAQQASPMSDEDAAACVALKVLRDCAYRRDVRDFAEHAMEYARTAQLRRKLDEQARRN